MPLVCARYQAVTGVTWCSFLVTNCVQILLEVCICNVFAVRLVSGFSDPSRLCVSLHHSEAKSGLTSSCCGAECILLSNGAVFVDVAFHSRRNCEVNLLPLV